MAATYYEVHGTSGGFESTKVKVPDGKRIAVSDNNLRTITIKIPSGTLMGIGTSVGNSSEWYNFNYCAYFTIEYTGKNSKGETVKVVRPTSTAVDTISTVGGSSGYSAMSSYIFLFKTGVDSKSRPAYADHHESNWTRTLNLAEGETEKTLTFTAPSTDANGNTFTATSYKVYVSGCTVNTNTIRACGDLEYNSNTDVYTAGTNAAWWFDKTEYNANKARYLVGGNTCGCTEHISTLTEANALWANITKGSVEITDHGNNTFTVSGTNGKSGNNNSIKTTSLVVKLGNTTLTPSGSNGAAGGGLANSSQDTFSYNYTITASGTITAELTNTGNKGDTATASDEADVKFYTPPKWKNTTSLTFTSGDSGQYNNRPRLKKPLKWAWTGAEAGNTEDHNVIRGYQIYICNGGGGTDKAVGLYPYRGKFTLNSGNTSPGAKVFETSTNNSAGAYDYVINRGTTNNTLVTDGSGNISFTPKDLGFASKNICYCRVRPFSYWGNRVATIELDSDGNKADYTQYAKNYGPWLIGICTADGGDNTATYIKGTQCILSNGAVVWVRVDTDGDDVPDTWKEGTVYVYHDGEWKEAEGVYVRNGGEWKEST